jgi:hypothetical protein
MLVSCSVTEQNGRPARNRYNCLCRSTSCSEERKYPWEKYQPQLWASILKPVDCMWNWQFQKHYATSPFLVVLIIWIVTFTARSLTSRVRNPLASQFFHELNLPIAHSSKYCNAYIVHPVTHSQKYNWHLVCRNYSEIQNNGLTWVRRFIYSRTWL